MNFKLFLGPLSALLAFAFVLSGRAPLYAHQAQYVLLCNDCHGMPPIDSPYRNISTGGFRGNHLTHNPPSVSPQNACEKCHSGSSGFTSGHSNGLVNMTTNINRSPHPSRATYNKPRFFNQTSNPVLQTCSNVNCHFETVTPLWESAYFSSPADCTRCHAAAPNDGNHPYGGQKHAAYYGTDAASCGKCHPDHTAEAKPFAHATSAGNRSLSVRFDAAPNNGFGRYTGNVTYPYYLPSQNAGRSGTCKSTYCHSPGTQPAASAAAPNASASWGGTLDCTGCHKGAASGKFMATGNHYAHVFGGGTTYSQIKCYTCHGSTAAPAMTVSDRSRHVNGQVEVAFNSRSSAASGSYNGSLATPASPSVKAPGSAYATCQNVYCHSTAQADGGSWPPVYTAPTWGSAATGKCGTCHGVTGSTTHGGFPNAMVQRRISSGSHKKHLRYVYGISDDGMRCAICHAYDRASFSTAGATCGPVCHTGTSLKHANYAINVNIASYFGAAATYNGSSTPGDGYSSCSTVYCHSDGLATPVTYATPTWGNAASGACGTCHGASAAAPPASAPHAKHVGAANPYRFPCAGCHSGKVQATASATVVPAFTNSTTHVNKARNVKFDSGNQFGTYSTASTSCRNLYCHSTGNSAVAPGSLPGVYGGKVYTRVAWSGATTCVSCHGRSTASGVPDYANAGSPGSATSNSHAAHVGGSADCVKCHAKTTSNGTSILSGSTHHVDQNRDVNFSRMSPFTAYSGAYGSAAKTCTATYCHGGAVTSPAWGATGPLSCDTCHQANNALPAGHGIHYAAATLATSYTAAPGNSNTGAYQFACTSCHGLSTSSHANSPRSAKRAADLFFGWSSAGRNPTYNDGATGTADSRGFNYTTDGYATGSAAGTCNTTYCHSGGAGQNGLSTSYTWNTAASAAGGSCNRCHGTTAYPADYRRGAPLYASGSISFNGAAKGNAHQLHLDAGSGAAATSDPQCRHCHAATTTDNTTIADKAKHLNKQYEISAGSTFADGDAIGGAAIPVTLTYTYGAAGSSCTNVSCHPTGLSGAKSSDTAPWSNGHSCDDCHKIGLRNSTGYHHAMRSYSGSGSAYPKTVPGATAGANDTSRRCTMCHVDHDTFSPNLNASNTTYGSAGNLRMSIMSSVTATKGYINRDLVKTGSGGICISCHNSELYKDTGNVRVKNETNSTRTPAIVLNNYTGSAHEYAVSSTMKRDGTAFYADCSKCHNGRAGESAAFSGMTTAVHDRDVRRMYASLGTTMADGNDEMFCYRCHSKAADATGGTKKTADAKDWYGAVTNMTAKSTAIYLAFQKANKHNVAGYTGIHVPSLTDDNTNLATRKHVECADCHNAHSATAANPTRGAMGVNPANSASNWTAPTGYGGVSINGGDDEYKICLRCHSGYNTSLTTWNGAWTDAGKEFSTGNASYHWVEGDKGAAKASTTYGNFNMTYVYKMMPRYNAFTNAQLRAVRMRCSDCHGSDNADTSPNGPHGSTYAKMLKVPAGSPYTVWNSASKVGDTNIWCFNCHDQNFTNSGFSGADGSLHTSKHSGSKGPCQVCHVKIPHGYTLPRLVKGQNTGTSPYNGTGGTGGVSAPTWKASGTWTESSCNPHQSCN